MGLQRVWQENNQSDSSPDTPVSHNFQIHFEKAIEINIGYAQNYC